MQFLTAGLLVIWALAVAVMSTLGVRGQYRTASVNGMRRRRRDESDGAWQAGLAALYPWTLASAAMLLLCALLILAASLTALYPLLLSGVALAVTLVYVGIGALNRAVRKAQSTEREEGRVRKNE
jgi:hypothetical protein